MRGIGDRNAGARGLCTQAVVDYAQAVQSDRDASRIGPPVHSRVRTTIAAIGIARRSRAAAVRSADGRRSVRINAGAGGERGKRDGGNEVSHRGYLGGSRSAERKARITSSRLFSLISSSAKSVGRSSVGVSTGLSLKKLGACAAFAAAGAAARAGAGSTGARRGGVVGRVGCPGWRVTRGSGAPGVRGGAADGGAACQTGAAGLGGAAAGFAAVAARAGA